MEQPKKKKDICSWSHNKRKENWYSYCSLASSYQIWSKCSHSWSTLNIPQAFTMYHHCSEFSTYLRESSCLTLTTAWKGKYHYYGCFTKKVTQLQVAGLGFRCRQPGSRTVLTAFGLRSAAPRENKLMGSHSINSVNLLYYVQRAGGFLVLRSPFSGKFPVTIKEDISKTTEWLLALLYS